MANFNGFQRCRDTLMHLWSGDQIEECLRKAWLEVNIIQPADLAPDDYILLAHWKTQYASVGDTCIMQDGSMHATIKERVFSRLGEKLEEVCTSIVQSYLLNPSVNSV